jgi:hypothetical protein
MCALTKVAPSEVMYTFAKKFDVCFHKSSTLVTDVCFLEVALLENNVHWR